MPAKPLVLRESGSQTRQSSSSVGPLASPIISPQVAVLRTVPNSQKRHSFGMSLSAEMLGKPVSGIRERLSRMIGPVLAGTHSQNSSSHLPLPCPTDLFDRAAR